MSQSKRKRRLYNLKRFFPVQLLLLHVRRSYLLLAFWGFLFALSGGWIFDSIGIPYLFKTPEYLGQVRPMSYLIVGVVLGLFMMSYHICSYIFYSYRYPFLATLSRPLWVFSINNSSIPFVYYIFYSVVIVTSLSAEGEHWYTISLSLLYLYFGSILSITVVLTYFFSTIKSLPIKKIPETIEKPLKAIFREDKKMGQDADTEKGKVNTYLKNFVTIRPTRAYKHYTDKQKLDVLQKHHLSAAIFFILILGILFVLSFFEGNAYLQIPAGASIILILTMYLMFIGALYSRFKTWTISLTLFLFVSWNFLSGLPLFEKVNKAYGLDYSSNAPYTTKYLESITSADTLQKDKGEMLEILNNWRAKFPEGEKPKMVIVNSSGGGLRSALWSLGTLQKLDSASHGDFSKHTFLISGSSGGMIGSAYYRELKIQEKEGNCFGINTKSYYDKLGKDMLNSIVFSWATNDLFISLNKVEVGGESYNYNRGLAFEHMLLENTDYVLDKSIGEYKKEEAAAEVPLMVLTPTIINEGRRMIISPQNLSFLAINQSEYSSNASYNIDGVEFKRFFRNQKSDDLRLTSALRMSATFPYITPLVNLPSEPRIELIDAGARDNDGSKIAMRFLFEFNDWLAENTSGVVVVKLLADRAPEFTISETPLKTKMDALVKPISGVFTSFTNLQEYSYSRDLSFAESWMKFDFNIQEFPLLNEEDVISLSWHLTNKEEKSIYSKMLDANFNQNLEAVISQIECPEEH